MKTINFKLLIFIVVITIIIPIANTNAQKQKSLLIEMRGDSLYGEAVRLFQLNKHDSSLLIFKECANYYKKLKFKNKYISVLNDICHVLNKLDRTSDQKEALEFALNEAIRLLPENDVLNIRARENEHSYYYDIGNYDKALELLNEVLPIKLKYASKLELALSYLNIGNIQKDIGAYHDAINSYKKGIDLQNDTIPNYIRSADLLNNIARVHLLNLQIDSALLNLNNAEIISRNVRVNSPDINYRIETFQLFAQAYIESQQFRLAKENLSKIKTLAPSKYYTVIWNKTNANLLYNEGKLEESIQYYLKAIDLAESSKTRMTPPDQVRRLIAIGDVYAKASKIDLALNSYQKGLNVLAIDDVSEDYRFNPSIENMLDKVDGLNLFHKKAILLSKKYNLDKDPQLLLYAYEALQSATSLIVELRKGIQSTESKKSLAERTLPIYETAINNSLALYNLEKEKKYLNQAFNYTEQIKALLLLEKLSDKIAKGYGGIPDDLLKKEKELQLQYSFLKNKLIAKKRNYKGNDQLFKLNEELNALSREFEKDYPRYYDLKYNFHPISINQCQKEIIDHDEALIEYFVGDTSLIRFVLTKDSVYVDKSLYREKVKSIIYDLKKIISKPPSAVDSKKELDQFVSTSTEAHKLLFGNSISDLSNDIKSLIIVPDDFLNSIPFDILMTSEPDAANSYGLKSLNYLFEDYNISYNYSATILNKIKSKEEEIFKGDLIGYAPKFEGDNLSSIRNCSGVLLSNLECNEVELNKISKFVDGTSRMGKDASAADFIVEAKDFKIIHLATHACVDQNNSVNSRIYLTGDYLTENDIYNLNLNAEMAVLSACNTGSGEIVKGEGVMNLAKGFLNAGCSSAVMSLWSVDDCRTADLMAHFYKYINKGYSKDEALRKAKLTYLEKAHKTKTHPYYWSSFVSFGDMKPIDIKKSSYFKYLMALLVMILGFYSFKKIRQNKTV